MAIVLSDEDDDIPLDTLVTREDDGEITNSNTNNNANHEIVELLSEDDSGEESETSESTNPEDLLKEIKNEKKKNERERRKKLKIIRQQQIAAEPPPPPAGEDTPPPLPAVPTRQNTSYYRRGSFVLRKETHEDDESISDMDCDSEEEEPEAPTIEVNVKVPSFQPRVLKRGTPSVMIGPRRVSPGKFITQKPKAQKAKSDKIKKSKTPTEPIEIPDDPPVEEKFDDKFLQQALDEISKEVKKYKLDTELKSEATYWMTLVQEGVCKWSNTEAIEEFIDRFEVPHVEDEEVLNNTAIAEIMGELKKKSNNEQSAGVGAWKKRAKVDNMFVARTLKNQILTGLKFDQQKKQVDRRLNADRVAEERQKEQRLIKSRQRRRSEEEVVCTGHDFAADAKVTVLPIPKDMPREERHLLERASQELLREAAAFVKGRNAKKLANYGYELGANLNSDGSHRQGQTFISSNAQLQSVVSGAKGQSWRQNVPGPMTPSGAAFGPPGLNRKGCYISEVKELARCSFSDALLGYNWTSDAHFHSK